METGEWAQQRRTPVAFASSESPFGPSPVCEEWLREDDGVLQSERRPSPRAGRLRPLGSGAGAGGGTGGRRTLSTSGVGVGVGSGVGGFGGSRGGGMGGGGGGGELRALCALCQLPVQGLSTWCLSCGHGGHADCMMAWRGESVACPAACGCECRSQNGRVTRRLAAAS